MDGETRREFLKHAAVAGVAVPLVGAALLHEDAAAAQDGSWEVRLGAMGLEVDQAISDAQAAAQTRYAALEAEIVRYLADTPDELTYDEGTGMPRIKKRPDAPITPPPPPPPPTTYGLYFSSGPNRTNPQPLGGATVTGNLYAFTLPDTDVTRVTFFVDGAQVNSETQAPFDLQFGGSATAAAAFDSTTLTNGAHTISADLTLADGAIRQVAAAITVDNSVAGGDWLRTVNVSTQSELNAALAAALPGDDIVIAAGTYGVMSSSLFSGSNGTQDRPIRLRGATGDAADVVFQGSTFRSGGGSGVINFTKSWYVLEDFTARMGQKGLMIEGSSDCIWRRVVAKDVGDECWHIRKFSRRNRFENCHAENSGNYQSQYGEGFYVGTDGGSWTDYTSGQPDTSDDNVFIGCTVTDVTADGMEIKDGTNRVQFITCTVDGASAVPNATGGGFSQYVNPISAKGKDFLIDGCVVTNARGWYGIGLHGSSKNTSTVNYSSGGEIRNCSVAAHPEGCSAEAYRIAGTGRTFRCSNTASGTFAGGLSTKACVS